MVAVLPASGGSLGLLPNHNKLLFPIIVCPLAATGQQLAVFICREIAFRSSRDGRNTTLFYVLCKSRTNGPCARMRV